MPLIARYRKNGSNLRSRNDGGVAHNQAPTISYVSSFYNTNLHGKKEPFGFRFEYPITDRVVQRWNIRSVPFSQTESNAFHLSRQRSLPGDLPQANTASNRYIGRSSTVRTRTRKSRNNCRAKDDITLDRNEVSINRKKKHTQTHTHTSLPYNMALTQADRRRHTTKKMQKKKKLKKG